MKGFKYMEKLGFEVITQMMLVFTAAFYLLQCFWGYKFIKVYIAISGFVVGFVAGFFISFDYYTADAYIPTAIGIAAGAVLAFIAFRLYLLGVFIVCGTLAASAVSKIPFSADGSQDILKIVLCVIAFIIVGILGVKFAKLCIILVTAIGGAINAINTLSTPIQALDENIFIHIAAIAILAAAGIIVQRIITKNER